MKDNLTPQDVTPEVKEAVANLIACRAVAEVTRARVDVVQRQVLQSIDLYTDLRARHEGREVERITDPTLTYLSEDEVAVAAYFGMVDVALKAQGIKPRDMDPDYCPALIAEDEQRKAEMTVLNAAATMMEMDFDGAELNHRLLCRKDGLAQRQEFIDLMCKIVINLPEDN